MKKLIENWRQGWKFYSVWLFALVAAFPDLYMAVVAMGWLDSADVPKQLVWALRGLGVVGVFARFVSQTRPKGNGDV